MRQLLVRVGPEHEDAVLRIGEEYEAFPATAVTARRRDGSRCAVVLLALPNGRVGEFVHAVEQAVDEVEFVLVPRGVIPFRKPVAAVRDDVRSVSHLSALELVLGSLQSVGSWRGMLLYGL